MLGVVAARGAKSSQAVVQKRLEDVEDLLSQGYTRKYISRKLGLKSRTTDRYCSLVAGRWHKEHAANRPHQVELMLARLERRARAMEKAEAWGALASLERLVADIRGLRAPEKVQVQGAILTASVPARPAYEELTAHLTEEQVGQLLRIAEVMDRVRPVAELAAPEDPQE